MSEEALYHNVLLLLVLIFPMLVVPVSRNNRVVDVPRPFWGVLVWLFAVWCMATVPVYLGTWTDRGAYGGAFVSIAQGNYHFDGLQGEAFFTLYMKIVSLVFSDYHIWFYVTAIIYVGNYLLAANKLTREYSFVLFLSMVCSFQFMGYGYNTIRAGFAGSLVMLGLSYCNQFPLMLFCFFISFFCHHSMAIPIGALALAYYMPDKTKWFIRLWFLCIIGSFFLGSTFESIFSGLINDGRSHYLMTSAEQTVYKVGFRWDFLLYSALPVALGYYYLYVLKFRSVFYHWIYNAYLIANAFWVLVIRAEFTDRFAYLSWFMFPILLMYPLLTQQLYRDVYKQKQMIVYVLMGQFAFTYYMYLAYNGFKMF